MGKRLLRGGDVFFLAVPGHERCRLERAAVREGQPPGRAPSLFIAER